MDFTKIKQDVYAFYAVTIYRKAFPELSKTKATRIILSRLRVSVKGFCLTCTLALTEAGLFVGMFSAVSGGRVCFSKTALLYWAYSTT